MRGKDKRKAPLTGVDLVAGDGLGFLAESYLVGLPFHRQVEVIEDEIIRAGKEFNDNAVCALLDLLERVIHLGMRGYLPGEMSFGEKEGKHKTGKHTEARKFFYDRIRDMWWKLPDTERVPDARERQMVCLSALKESKKKMLQEIVRWWGAELTVENIEVFRFFIAVFEPLPEKFPARPEESEAEIKARDREIMEDQRKYVLEMIQRHTGSDFKVEFLEQWLQQPYVPMSIQEVFLKARARNGGVPLVMRDIRNCQVLSVFKPEERSQEAIDLLSRVSESIADMDGAARNILYYMGVGWGDRLIRDDHSHNPTGRLEVAYGLTCNIDFIVIPNVGYPAKKHEDLLMKIKTYLNRWEKENPHHYQFSCCLGTW